ncbi:MAG: hypothetical protein H6R10_1815 [Rhodocyclaceae bacterium]|nr:hypothetical protein [Rhodocyclaceae bacterium]
MIRKTAPVFLLAFLLPSLAMAQGAVQWGSSDKPYRQPANGMKGYYEPEKVTRDGDTVSFKIYRSADPVVPDELGNYTVNCDTREYVTTEKGKATPPMKLLAGEQIYPMAAKFCEWGDGKGFFKQFF